MVSYPAEPAGSAVTALSVLGTPVVVRCAAGTAARVRRLYAPFVTATAAVGARELTTGDRLDDLADLAAEVNALALADAPYLAVHAGAVAAGGAVVAFPAASGAGKTTLTAACLRAGLDYVSDEALCLGWADGAVTPYPRPLALSPWSATAVGLAAPAEGGELLIEPAELGAVPAAPPLRVAHVVLLDPPGPGGPLRPETRSAVVAELLRRSFTHWRRPERAFELVHETVRAASVWRLTPSDPATDAAAIAALLRHDT